MQLCSDVCMLEVSLSRNYSLSRAQILATPSKFLNVSRYGKWKDVGIFSFHTSDYCSNFKYWLYFAFALGVNVF